MRKKTIKIIKNKDEEKKDKQLYTLVGFFMILIIGVWALNLKNSFNQTAHAQENHLVSELAELGTEFLNKK